MFRKCLAYLLVFVQVAACSSAKTTIPVSTQEKIASSQPMVIASPSVIPTFTSTVEIKPSPTNQVTKTITPHVCPDEWFENQQSPVPPIFLMIFGSLYTAYRYDALPDRDLFKLPSAPAKSFAVSFSQDQQLMAYYLPKKGSSPAELWVSDVTMCNPVLIYKDYEGRIGETTSFAYFQWGPGDKTLIFRSVENEFPMLIYQMENQEIEFWQGVCEDILYVGETDDVVVSCSHDEKFSYLHPDGKITTVPGPPKPTDDPVVFWSFSKEGDASYITSAQEVYLLRRSGQKLKLPFKGFTLMSLWDPDPLHWATNRDRLLVLAYDPQEKRCPDERACWFVVDGMSGKILWWLKPETIEKGPQWQWENINTMHPASISPDGEILALQYYQLSLKFLLIIRLSTSEVLIEDNIFSDQMVWPSY